MKKTYKILAVPIFTLLINLPSFSVDKKDVIGVWLFDEGKGDVAKDSSGNKNDGKLIASLEWVKNGKFGGCLQYTAAKLHNVRVPVAHSDSLTVAMWANYKNLASNNIGLIHIQAGELDGGNPDTKIVGMWVENSSTLWGRIIPSGAGKVNFPKNEKLKADTWYHISMVIDSEKKKATQYVNAKSVGEVEYKGGKLTKFDFANIGRQGSESWDGLLDEVIMFNKAVSTDELKTVMKGIEQNVLSVEANDKLAITWAEVKQ